jgi:hypothetical protein
MDQNLDISLKFRRLRNYYKSQLLKDTSTSDDSEGREGEGEREREWLWCISFFLMHHA